MVQEAGLLGRAVEAEGALHRHENIIKLEVVAAGAAQPNYLPGIKDGRRLHRRKEHHRVRPARLSQAGAVVIHHLAVDEEPVGVVDAAGVVPASADPVAAGHRTGLAQGAE